MKTWIRVRRFFSNRLLWAYWQLLQLSIFLKVRNARVVKCFPYPATKNEEAIPVGAVWEFVPPGNLAGLDGKVVCVETPGGCWCIDSHAANCEGSHEHTPCWVRHGSVEDGTLAVHGAKECPGGNGSIRIGSYHARLYRGHLVQLLW